MRAARGSRRTTQSQEIGIFNFEKNDKIFFRVDRVGLIFVQIIPDPKTMIPLKMRIPQIQAWKVQWKKKIPQNLIHVAHPKSITMMIFQDLLKRWPSFIKKIFYINYA